MTKFLTITVYTTLSETSMLLNLAAIESLHQYSDELFGIRTVSGKEYRIKRAVADDIKLKLSL